MNHHAATTSVGQASSAFCARECENGSNRFRLITSALAKKYHVTLPDYLLFPDWTRELSSGGYENYRKEILRQWTSIPEGVTETFLHPARECEELKAITPNWFQRVWEYRLMDDPDTHAFLKAHGVEMISYRDLASVRK